MEGEDIELSIILKKRGLLAPDEIETCEAERKTSGRPLAEIVVEKGFLNAQQLNDVRAAIRKKVRFCLKCREVVTAPRVMPEGEVCPRCLGLVEYQEEQLVSQVEDVQQIVGLTQDKLPPEVQTASRSPQRIFGKYILLQELGRGGHGMVRKAWDTLLGRYVALKFIIEGSPGSKAGTKTGSGSTDDPQERVRLLLQEARTSTLLRHAHIVPIFDVGRVNEQYYISMEFIDGSDMAKLVEEAKKRNQPSCLYENPALHLRILRDVAEALHYAHSFPSPIVHCDLKPSNIIANERDGGFLTDFGLSQVLKKVEDEDIGIRGTPPYMAPEQVKGRFAEIGPWTDVYGLGAVLYVLLTGRLMFFGKHSVVLEDVANKPVTPPSEVVAENPKIQEALKASKLSAVFPRLEEICLDCVAKRPEERYRSTAYLAEDLAAVLENAARGRPAPALRARAEGPGGRADGAPPLAAVEAARIAEMASRPEGQAVLVEEFLRRLAERLNERHPMIPEFSWEGGRRGRAEVVKATPARLYLLSRGEVGVADWPKLAPEQVAELRSAARLSGADDRLGLALLLLKAGKKQAAAAELDALCGTALEETANRLKLMGA